MTQLRRIHLYLGCIFAPILIFFAVTGSWQLYVLHVDTKDGRYVAPRITNSNTDSNTNSNTDSNSASNSDSNSASNSDSNSDSNSASNSNHIGFGIWNQRRG